MEWFIQQSYVNSHMCKIASSSRFAWLLVPRGNAVRLATVHAEQVSQSIISSFPQRGPFGRCVPIKQQIGTFSLRAVGRMNNNCDTFIRRNCGGRRSILNSYPDSIGPTGRSEVSSFVLDSSASSSLHSESASEWLGKNFALCTVSEQIGIILLEWIDH